MTYASGVLLVGHILVIAYLICEVRPAEEDDIDPTETGIICLLIAVAWPALITFMYADMATTRIKEWLKR